MKLRVSYCSVYTVLKLLLSFLSQQYVYNLEKKKHMKSVKRIVIVLALHIL